MKLKGFKNLPQDTELVLGVRPDVMEQSAKGQIKMRVDLVEQHGGENLVYGAIDGCQNDEGEELEACIKTNKEILPALDENLTLKFDPATAFVFRKDTGERLI